MSQSRGPMGSMSEATRLHPDRLLEILGLSWKYLEGKDVLDIGASRSTLAHEASMRGIRMTPIDKRKSQFARSYESLVIGDADNLPFKDGAFDIAICTYGPLTFADEHIDILKRRLEEAYRVVRVGGEVRTAPWKESTQIETINISRIFSELQKSFPALEMHRSTASTKRFDRYYFKLPKN